MTDPKKEAEPHPQLLGSPLAVIEEQCDAWGYPSFRARQMWRWLYQTEETKIENWKDLPAPLRALVAKNFQVGITPPQSVLRSEDGTKKYLFGVSGKHYVEAAVIPDGDRTTLCLSSQVGCARACVFCQTGRQGLTANLTTGDILNQYHSLPERNAVTNIVFMGMGEPLDNLEPVIAAIGILTSPTGYALGKRRITLSTVGIHPALESFLDRSTVSLAISLHSPFADERRSIVPVERDHPIEKTLSIVRRRREDRERKITIEYALFAGVNDEERHARELARLVSGLRIRVNLIPYHPIASSQLVPASEGAIGHFQDLLRDRGVRTFVRKSRGQDIEAACGMLWTRNYEEVTAPHSAAENRDT